MRKQFLFLFLATIVGSFSHAQTKGTKVGYIDMEYILQNVSSYTEANAQLEQKAQKWKQEIEVKKVEIDKIKVALQAEKALLTKNLIEEREAEIRFLEREMLDYQQKRFGANGDLMLQKMQLTKPIQDQVFTAVQDLAESNKYDFIFDRSSDLTMLFAAKRYDLSDQVLRALTRTDKREQLSKKQLEQQEARESKEDAIDSNEALQERQKLLDERKAARDKILEERKAAVELKKKEYYDRKAKLAAEREARKNGTVSANTTTTSTSKETDTKLTDESAQQKLDDMKAQKAEERKKLIEDRKKVLEERRAQILKQRDSILKSREQK
jgi:Skp family chaperone for outer membrane proteins